MKRECEKGQVPKHVRPHSVNAMPDVIQMLKVEVGGLLMVSSVMDGHSKRTMCGLFQRFSEGWFESRQPCCSHTDMLTIFFLLSTA